MYARRVGDRDLTFDFVTGLVKNNLLISDRETRSIWSQLDGKAISGPLEGEPMRVVPSLQTTWKHWRELHPDTRAMVVEGEEGRLYWYRDRTPGKPRPKERPTAHDTKNLGLGLALSGQAVFYPLRELDKLAADALPLAVTVGGRKIRVHYRGDAMTAWAVDADGGLLAGVMAYEVGWRDFHPETVVFSGD